MLRRLLWSLLNFLRFDLLDTFFVSLFGWRNQTLSPEYVSELIHVTILTLDLLILVWLLEIFFRPPFLGGRCDWLWLILGIIPRAILFCSDLGRFDRGTFGRQDLLGQVRFWDGYLGPLYF